MTSSFKGLVDNECGSQNPLLKLASHFTTDRTLINQDGIKSHTIVDENEFVNEYFNDNPLFYNRHQRKQAPQTFHMENLFSELLNIDNKHTNNLTNINLNSRMAADWSSEYTRGLQSQSKFNSNSNMADTIVSNDVKWSTEYLTQRETTLYDDAWESLLRNNPQSNEALLNDEMKKTANELLESMQDSRFSETEFLTFVKDLKQKTAYDETLNNSSSCLLNNDEEDRLWADTLKDVELSLNLSSNSAQIQNAVQLNESDQWINEFENLKPTSTTETFWDDLNEQWDTTARSNPDHPWLDEFEKVFDTYRNYEFDKENPLVAYPNSFEEGLKRLKEHDIVNAVLLFEAAVQKEPNNMLAWQYLGTTQVENEQDAQAIRALKKCLELQKDNLTALSTLATSYTNESMQRLAYDCLFNWLQANTKYSHLVKGKLLPSMQQTQLATMSIVHIKDFLELQEIYLEAVRESSSQVDPDLQCCLGVLFHVSGEFDKAADCFKTALQIKPNDHLLWNKLGATYANSNRNEEAIEAYYNALQLCPGFVRARYNLGIGCMNLGAYKEAVEHFLTALSQQSQANIQQHTNHEQFATQSPIILKKINSNQNQMSETIWSTLRLALSYLNRTDLYQSCNIKDLDNLKKQFSIE